MVTKYTEYYNQAERLYSAIVKKSSANKATYTPDELRKVAWELRKNGDMSDFVFDYIANLTYDLDDSTLEFTDEELAERQKKLGDLILDYGADVKIMDRLFWHREVPHSENFSKPGFQLKTA